MNELCDIDIPFWIDFPANGAIPRGALKAGIFKGESLYIGRAMHNNALTSGSIVPSHRTLYVAWGFASHKKTEFQILIGGNSCNWVYDEGGNVPVNAFISGHTEQNESTFIGRVKRGDDILIGKIHPSFKTCYVPGITSPIELEYHAYEVFVV